MRKRMKQWLIAFLAVALLMLPVRTAQAQAAAEEKKPYEIQAEVGYQGVYNSYRQLPVKVSVTNNEADLIGRVELLFIDGSGKTLNYKQELVLAAGETKEVYFLVMPPINTNFYGTVRLVNEKEEVLTALPVQNNSTLVSAQMMMGILSEQESVNYFTGSAEVRSIVEFLPEYLVDADQMEMLDALVVDQFDLDALSTEQILVLEEWVEKGGTLVLGTGSRYNQTLSSFSGEFLSGKVGDLKTIDYVYGKAGGTEGLTEELTYCPLTLNDAVPVLRYGEDVLLWRVDRGKGSVLVSAIGLELPSWLAGSLGEDLYQAISQNLSEERQSQIIWEQNGGSYTWHLSSALRQGNEANTPNMLLYSAVLVIYILVVGPALYLVLKKCDKRHYMWGLVPVFSLVFTGIVFLLGIPTRIREPYMSYVTYLDYGTETPAETTYFTLTAPYNRTYNVQIEKDYRISMERNYGYISVTNGTIFEEYDIGFTSYENGTDIELRDPAAFEDFTFLAKGEAENEGTYESSLVMGEDGKLSGYFTNNLGYDLEYVFLAHAREAYYVGPVANGETVQIQSDKLPSALSTSYYGLENTGFIEREAFNYQYNSDMETARKYYALSFYLNNEVYRMGEGAFFAGVAAESPDGCLTAGSAMKHYGAVVSVLPVQDLEGDYFESSIDAYEYALLEGASELPHSRYMLEATVTMEYDLRDLDPTDGAGEPASISYQAKYNNELRSEYWDYFPGKVYFRNKDSDEFDLIFESSQAGVCDDLTPYLADGHLVIRYEVEPDQFYNERYNIVIPVLSLTRKEDGNGTD